ncbi:unnamed protein product [Aspergillus oryzae]|nr:unnamed protein product [Aspergillus oryzae]GMF91607.1 unnamed protein product [Aspergillus oryzae]
MHINPELIGIRRVRPLPSRDPTSTPPKHQATQFQPCSAKPVQEISLFGHDAGVEISIPQFSNVYRILVTVEPGIIEPAVGTGEAQCICRTGRLFGVDVPEINIVGPEVATPERCTIWDGEALGSGPCQTCVEGRRNDQNAGVDILRVDSLLGGCSPPDVNRVR